MAVLVKFLPQFLLRLFVPMLFLCLAAWAIMLFIPFVRKQVRPVFSFSDGRGGRVPPMQCVVIVFVMVACTLFSGKNTNGVQNLPPRSMQQLPAPTPPTAPSIFDYPRTITETRAASGFALVGVGTNETFTFDPPTNATVCADWRMYGSASRWTHVSPTNFAFPFGGTNAITFTFVPGGVAELAGGADVPRVAPFNAKMGIAPERYWDSLGVTSRFWTAASPSNTFLATWQGALLGRRADRPVDVQLELFPDGGFDFRYDLSRLASDGDLADARVAAWNAAGGETYSVPHRNLTSARWRHVAPDDAVDPDRDNDGVTTVDELFFLGTDPGNPDSDFDGLSDGYEIAHGLNPLDPYSNGGPYSDGFSVALGGEDPLSCPPGSTNTVLEHVFYSGTTNGAFACPQPSDGLAVLSVTASGSGTGDLVVGSRVVPLVVPPPQRGGAPLGVPLFVLVPKGVRHRVVLRGDPQLEAAVDSGEFAIGEMPRLMEGDPSGWICFPRTTPAPVVACIHDLCGRKVDVRLEPGDGAGGIAASWCSSAAVAAQNHADGVSATLTGNFDASHTARVWYELVHPQYLFGNSYLPQSVRFCPRPSDADDEPEDEPEDDPDPDPEPPDDGDDDLYDGDRNEETDSSCSCCNYCGQCSCHAGEAPPDVSGPVPTEPSDPEDPEAPPPDCPVHNCPYSECYELHEDNAPRTVTVPSSTHVLTVGRVPSIDTVLLAVPEGAVNCCPCPDHWTNYVGVAYKSGHLVVKDGDGLDFWRSETDCTVYVSGLTPTRAAAGAPLAFATNGAISVRRNYAVLGVDIDTPLRAVGILNALSPSFGVPATVCTNTSRAAGIDLVTRVRLAAGAVTLAAGGGAFQAWLDRSHQGRPPLLLVDGTARPTVTMSLAKWRSLAGLTGDESEARTRVFLTSATPGSRTLTFSFTAGGALADSVTQNITFVNPPLLPDYNRDGVVDAEDVAAYVAGRIAYFWVNDDRYKDDDAFSFSTSLNSSDWVVNGRNDLINFLSLAIDVREFVSRWGTSQVRYRLEPGTPTMELAKLAFADIEWPQIGNAQLGTDFDMSGNPIYEASVGSLGSGTNIPSALVSLSPSQRGVVLAEFPVRTGAAELYLCIYSADDDALLFSAPTALHVGDVSQMVGWLNLRDAAGGSGGVPTRLTTPDWPAEVHESGNVVFVHGYNMEEDEETPLWARNVFKKLWWSGLDRGFVAVQWYGNEGQLYVPGKGWVTPNYYGNVQNAFATAAALKTAMDEILGSKWLLAHSLGNMLVSAAIQDWQMPHEKYFMLNAAVAMEAYDPAGAITQASHDNMTPEAWTNYTDKVRATHWFERFPEGDGRRLLTWKGRFSGVTNIVNFYSTQEEVVNNGDGGFHPLTIRDFVWYNQETRKGLWPLMLHEYEGGWEFNSYYDTVTNYWVGDLPFSETYHMPPAAADQLPDEQLQQIPFFLDFINPEMHSSSNGAIVANNYLYRAEMLAYAIPSESFAAGANSMPDLDDIESLTEIRDGNYDMATLFTSGRNELPVNENEPEKRHRDWQHSTFVQRSFKRVHQLYKVIIQLVKETQHE